MSSSIEYALESMQSVLVSKNADYKIDGEFSNFEFAAKVANVSTETVMMVMIGIKLGRLMGASQDNYNNESAADTIMDLAGYANILNAFKNHNTEDEVDF